MKNEVKCVLSPVMKGRLSYFYGEEKERGSEKEGSKRRFVMRKEGERKEERECKKKEMDKMEGKQ